MVEASKEEAFQRTILEKYNKKDARNMAFDELPPKKRKAILVISSHEREQLEYTPGGNDLLLNEQVHLLVPSYVTTSNLEDKLDKGGLLEPGNLLIQSPYDTSDYASLDKAYSTFALTKYLHFTTLCGLLGAREVIVEQIEDKSSTDQRIYKGSIDSRYIGGKVETENRTFDKITNQINLKSTFGGGEPDLEEAEDHLQKYQLVNDSSMKTLIDQRKGKNPIKSREVTLSLTEESERNLKVITDIKVPIYASLQAQIEQVKKERCEFILTIRVEF